jgi:hypothetical protein
LMNNFVILEARMIFIYYLCTNNFQNTMSCLFRRIESWEE